MKLHESGTWNVLAVCDTELVGTTLEDTTLGVSVSVSSNFYGGGEFDQAIVIEAIKTSNNVNLLGKRIIELAVKEGLVDNSNVMKIGDCFHAQIYSLE